MKSVFKTITSAIADAISSTVFNHVTASAITSLQDKIDLAFVIPHDGETVYDFRKRAPTARIGTLISKEMPGCVTWDGRRMAWTWSEDDARYEDWKDSIGALVRDIYSTIDRVSRLERTTKGQEDRPPLSIHDPKTPIDPTEAWTTALNLSPLLPPDMPNADASFVATRAGAYITGWTALTNGAERLAELFREAGWKAVWRRKNHYDFNGSDPCGACYAGEQDRSAIVVGQCRVDPKTGNVVRIDGAGPNDIFAVLTIVGATTQGLISRFDIINLYPIVLAGKVMAAPPPPIH